ncbi:MAG: glycerophosphodiester phosphodiesterase family protein [Bdellovibrionota bacterium]
MNRLKALLQILIFAMSLQASAALSESGVFAHRGYSKAFPENTLIAIRGALDLGVQGIEIDVRRTKDGELVLMHDSFVNRTTNGSGLIDMMSFAKVRSLDAGSWKGPQYKGERVPTLREALSIIPKDIWINLHIKDSKVVGAVAKLIVELGLQDQALIACSEKDIALVKAIDPALKTVNMTRGKNYVDRSKANGADWLQFRDDDGLASATDLARARALGLKSNECEVSDPNAIAELYSRGIDFVMSDDAATAVRVYNELRSNR